MISIKMNLQPVLCFRNSVQHQDADCLELENIEVFFLFYLSSKYFKRVVGGVSDKSCAV